MDPTTDLIRTMREKRLVLALAESVTCGLAAHKLGSRIGTSEMFAGSVVCYTPEVKMSLLKVSKRKIDRYTCESQEVTEALAVNLARVLKADVYAGITGLAAEGGSETKTKPVGTIFFSVWYKRKLYNYKKRFYGTPLEIRKKACMALFEFIRSKIEI